MEKVIETAHAKINLTLSVLGRRADGYHELDTLMHTVSLADTVEISPAAELSLSVTGNAPQGRENLAWRAAELFFCETGLPGGAALRLVKRVPSEAGLGGGSSDAAAVLRGLNRMTGAGLSAEELCRLGARLGADVPFCVAGGAARCRGIGEMLEPLPAWPGLPLLLVRPPVPISTAEAYKKIDGLETFPPRTTGKAAAALTERNFTALAAALANDFEAALFPSEPRLSAIKKELAAAGVPALMTGSGSAFFLFIGDQERERTAKKIKKRHHDWFVHSAETC